jgi:hypothetical protein
MLFLSCGNNKETPAPKDFKPAAEKRMDSITAAIAKARELQEAGKYEQAFAIADAMTRKYRAS